MAKLPKQAVTTLLQQLGTFTLKGLPGFNKQSFATQVQNAGLYLYESDLPKFLEKVEEPEKFEALLREAGAVLQGSRPAFGGKSAGTGVRINSRERAEQVVTSTEPNAVETFMEIMTEILNLAKEADKLIHGKGQISIAIKNVGAGIKRRKKVVEVADADGKETEDTYKDEDEV